MSDPPTTRECPYCREDVKAAAIRCKHCHAEITPTEPTHEGVCPYCKENIKVDAIRCKHCHADVGPATGHSSRGGCDCGCGGDCGGRPNRSGNTPVKRIPRARSVTYSNPPGIGACPDCPLQDIDIYGTWCLESCDETYCYLVLCEPATTRGVPV